MKYKSLIPRLILAGSLVLMQLPSLLAVTELVLWLTRKAREN